MNESQKLILKHFKKPDEYEFSPTEKTWEEVLKDCLETWGCDWLLHFQERMNPIPAQAIEDLCKRIEELENR